MNSTHTRHFRISDSTSSQRGSKSRSAQFGLVVEGEGDESVKICSEEGEMVMGGSSSSNSSSSNASNSCASSYVEDVLAQHPAMFGKVLANAPRFRFQVLLSYLVVDPYAPAPPRLVRHGYRVDKEYFYPASAIKLCAAVSAIGKLKQLEASLGTHVNCTTPLALYSLFEGTEEDRIDPSNANQKKITVAHEIRKILLVSDNKAFNRLFSFVGHRTMNQDMWDLGLQSTRLHHRLSEVRSIADNHYSEPFELNVNNIALTLPPKQSQLIVKDNSDLPGAKVGTAYISDDEYLVPEPMDFSMKNYMSLVDQQNLLIKLVRPDVQLDTPGINMDEAMRMLLMEAMAQYPSQSANPHYESTSFPDDYCKFFLPGLSRVRPKGALRIYNKIGRAYGFTVENSYVFDMETGRSFFLTAAIYTNANGVLNDDRYEYAFADSAMADLAEVLARALWQIPHASAARYPSISFDCIPSSLWTACSLPLMLNNACEGDNTEQQLDCPGKPDKQGSEEAEIPSTCKPSGQDQGSLCVPTALPKKEVGLVSKMAPTTGEMDINLSEELSPLGDPSRIVLVLPLITRASSCPEDGPADDGSHSASHATQSRNATVRSCYKFFVDE